MKKLLILIVFVALFLHFYPNEKLNNWLAVQKDAIWSFFSETTDTKVRLKADKIFTDLKDDFKSFTEEEIAYVKELTSSREKVEAFYHKHCEDKQYDGNLRTANLQKVCKKIAQYQSLF